MQVQQPVFTAGDGDAVSRGKGLARLKYARRDDHKNADWAGLRLHRVHEATNGMLHAKSTKMHSG
jgi:hypothetical protein